MTLFSYEIFDTVARQGSFNKAAAQLHLTPSAISHAIAVMEDELGFTLFNRGKNGVSLTSYGDSLYPGIKAVLNADEALQQSIAELNGLKKGRVRLGTFNSACTYLLPPILKKFMVEYPQIEVEIYQGTYDDIREWMKDGTVDVGLLSTSSSGDYYIRPIWKEPLQCLVPKGWPVPEKGVMTPEKMQGQPIVVQGESTDADTQNYFKKYKIEMTSSCHVVDDMSNIAMVEAGYGITLLPAMLAQNCNAAVDVYPVEPEEYREIVIALPHETASPAVEQLCTEIIKACDEQKNGTVDWKK